MSLDNPYATPQTSYPASTTGSVPRRITISPIEALSRGRQLLGDQYWLFMGICFVGIIIASLVPMGILMGPMMVGIFFCMLEREQGRLLEFGTLFRGFERFLDSLIAMILMMLTNLVLVLPVVIVFMGVMFASLDQRGQPNPGFFFGGLFLYMFLLFLAAMVSYLPYSFCFQLIADKKLSGLDAIKLSFKGVWLNLGPMILFALVGGMISFVLTLMCYIPVFFFMPIWFAAAFVMYREVFPEEIVDARIS